jgi:WD repeat-containing protein 35
VLIYEGIIGNVFEYDYVPISTLIGTRRFWINFSHDGQSDIECLREQELIDALIIPSNTHKPEVLYRISVKGCEFLDLIPQRDKDIVTGFAYKPGTWELMKVVWRENLFWLQSASGYERVSSITQVEDVSYVSSAYIPQCLRFGGRPTMSNAHRAYAAGFGAAHNIRDQDLNEMITLSSVSMIVSEYIPFGSNLVVELNNCVGSSERVRGGYIAPFSYEETDKTSIEVCTELTSVEILDYSLTNHINLEAEIRFPEQRGIVQVETFGISLNAEGTCFYGMQIEAIMDRIKDNISLDLLARVLVDVQQDSCTIVDSLLSQRQRDLLNLVYSGYSANRNKINLIIANNIKPALNAEEYLDKGDYENELKQVIGDVKAIYSITENDFLMFGSSGLLLCGPHSRSYEPLLCAYLQFITLDIFLQNIYTRIWGIDDDCVSIAKSIQDIDIDPKALHHIRLRISNLARDIIQIDEVISYVSEALNIMEIPPEPQEQVGRSLYNRLEISGMKSQLTRRTMDLQKNVKAYSSRLDDIRERVKAEAEGTFLQLKENLERNLENIHSMQIKSNEAVHSLQILQIIFAGMIAFEFLDRITGDWTVMDTVWMQQFVQRVIKESIMLWFLMSMFVWILVIFVVTKSYNLMNWRAKGLVTLKIHLNRRVDREKLLRFVARKRRSSEEHIWEGERTLVKLTYDESDPKSWGGTCPTVALHYDERNSFILDIFIQYKWRLAKTASCLTADQIKSRIIQELDYMCIKVDDRRIE